MSQHELAEDQVLPDGMALQVLARAPFAIVVTNPRLEDNPIVYVNDAFERTTGYARAAAIGRNCRFLQGADADPGAVRRIAVAIAEEREIMLDILNRRADGAAFWNRLLIAPLHDVSGELQYFVGVQKVLGTPIAEDEADGPDAALREIQHRVKNHLAMIVSMIRLQSREAGAAQHFDTLARRVESLQLLYEELTHRRGENRDAVALGAYLSRVASAIAHLDGRSGLRVNVDVEAFTVPMETAVRLGLILSEILTNALQHAFRDREDGLLETRIHELPDGGIRVRIADDGVGLPPGLAWPDPSGMGGRIVSQLSDSLKAQLSVTSGPTGTVVTLDVPCGARGVYWNERAGTRP